MNRSDLYYLPVEVDYRRQRAAKAARRRRRWSRSETTTIAGRRDRGLT